MATWALTVPVMTIFTASAADLRVVGTDLLGVEASQALYRFAGRAELPLVLAFDGSRPGLDQLKSGRADVALLVLAPDEIAATAGFESLTLAYHAVVVLVSASVPLDQMTVSQLRDVFGEGGSRILSRWGDFGLAGDFAASSIAVHAPAVGQGIAVEFFRQAVLKDRAFTSAVMRYATAAEMVGHLSGERRGLAVAPVRPPNAPGVKIVRVAVRANEPAYSPTPENLHSGDYPLALPLRLVFRREAARTLQPLLRFLFSDEFAAALEQVQVVPLAPAAREHQRTALEKP